MLHRHLSQLVVFVRWFMRFAGTLCALALELPGEFGDFSIVDLPLGNLARPIELGLFLREQCKAIVMGIDGTCLTVSGF